MIIFESDEEESEYVSGPFRSAAEMGSKIAGLAEKAAEKGVQGVLVVVGENPEGRQGVRGVMSAQAGQGGVYVFTTPDGIPPGPILAGEFSHGVEVEAAKSQNGSPYVVIDGEPREVQNLRLFFFEQSAIIEICAGEPGGADGMPRAGSVPGPQKAGEFAGAVDRLEAATRRPGTGEEVLACTAPGEDDTRIAVVDTVSVKSENSVVIDLVEIPFSQFIQMQDGMSRPSTLAGIAEACGRANENAYLFVTLGQETYQIAQIESEPGLPVLATLERWGDD